jgi:DNA-binding beta-propeller fold protein YncE
MEFHRGTLVVMLLALVASTATVTGEEITQEVRVEGTIPQPGHDMATGFDSVWMVGLGTSKLIRINPSDNSVTEIPIPGAVGPFTNAGLVAGEGALWLADHPRSIVYKIDPVTNRVAKEISTDLLGSTGVAARAWDELAAGWGAVWVITSNNELRRYSAESGLQEAAVALPSHSSGVIAAFGSVWITGTGNDELYRVDPTTNRITATIDLQSDPRSLAAGAGSVWVCNEGDGTVQRIDGKSGELVATIKAGAVGHCAIAVGGGFVWVSTNFEPIVQIDPRTNSVRGKFRLDMSEYSTIRFGAGSLWVSGGSVRRIKPPE